VYEWEELPDHLRKGPKWKVLVGTEVMLPEGFNACGAQEGFFAPNNQEQAIGQTKFSYLVDTPINRPQFAAKPKLSKSTSSKGDHPSKAAAPSEKGGPLPFVTNKFKDKHFATLRPKNFFDLQISPDFIKKNIINTTNAQATAEGAEGTTNQSWVPCTDEEVLKFTGLMFCNGISPKPQVNHWFMTTAQSRIFGNDAIANLFDARVVGGRVIKGEEHWSQFRRFMCLYDFRQNPASLQKKDPFWKVASIIKDLRKNAQHCWTTGKFVAIDKQTIGFKG
jgi:hypothetical protein